METMDCASLRMNASVQKVGMGTIVELQLVSRIAKMEASALHQIRVNVLLILLDTLASLLYVIRETSFHLMAGLININY